MGNTISSSQIRAALATLDWDNHRLARESGVSVDTIVNIKAGHHNPTRRIMDKVRSTLEQNGIEFTELDGVRRRLEDLRIMRGEGCYVRLMEHAVATLRGSTRKDICFYCIRDSLSSDTVTALVRAMREDGANTRFILEEGDGFMRFDPEDYRWIPSPHFNNDVVVVYDDYVGTLINKGEAVYLVHNASYAQTQRRMFDFVWQNCLKAQKKNA